MCNIVFGVGPRAGEAIVAHPDVAVVSFTGSTAVGERIQSVSALFCRKLHVSLEVSESLSTALNVSCTCIVCRCLIWNCLFIKNLIDDLPAN